MNVSHKIKNLSAIFVCAATVIGSPLGGIAGGEAYYHWIPRSEFVPQTIADLPQQQCMPGGTGAVGVVVPCNSETKEQREARLKEIQADPEKYLQQQHSQDAGYFGFVT